MSELNHQNRKNKWPLIGVIIILGLLGFFAWKFFLGNHSSVFTKGDWAGTWEVTYFYQNVDSLSYRGTLRVDLTDSLHASLDVLLPKSTRTVQPQVLEINISEDASKLTGYLVHDRYKINGGYLQEYFEFNLAELGAFEGKGWCQAYCAEGTEKQEIVWVGKKVE